MGQRTFRLFLSAQLLGSAGVWMLRMAADWLVLKLTGSPAAVGVLVALQFLPLLLVGPLGGVIADRHDKRRLVLVSQAASAVVAGTLAVLTLTHQVAMWHLCALAVALALFAAMRPTARIPTIARGPGQVREGFRFVVERRICSGSWCSPD